MSRSLDQTRELLSLMGISEDCADAVLAITDQLDAWKADHPDEPVLNRENEELFMQLGRLVIHGSDFFSEGSAL